MAGHAGLKKVVKTVHTKKGTKRQTFWVKAVADSKRAIKNNKPPSKLARVGLHVGAGALAAYGGYKLLKHLHGRGKDHVQNGHTMSFGKHAGRLVGAAAALSGGKANRASFARHGMYGNLTHESGREARPVTF